MLPHTDRLPFYPGRSNDRPVLVMSHSFGCARREWLEVVDILSDEYRTITIDVPGFGEARDITGYSNAERVEQFAQTIKELGLQRYVLIGHSQTARVMSILCSRYADKFNLPPSEKLILLTPSPLGPEPLPNEERDNFLNNHGDLLNAEKFVALETNLPLSPAVYGRQIEDYLRVHPAAWADWLTSGSPEDWVRRAAPIKTETLVIAAEKDKGWGAEMQRKLTMPHLDNGTLVVVPNSGHSVPVEAPEALSKLIREFVSD